MTDSGYAIANGRHASSPSWSFPLLSRRFVHGLGRQPRSREFARPTRFTFCWPLIAFDDLGCGRAS